MTVRYLSLPIWSRLSPSRCSPSGFEVAASMGKTIGRPARQCHPQPSVVDPLEEVAEDARRRAPDHVPVHLVGGGADRDAAAHQAAHRVALAKLLEREGEERLHLRRAGLQLELA